MITLKWSAWNDFVKIAAAHLGKIAKEFGTSFYSEL